MNFNRIARDQLTPFKVSSLKASNKDKVDELHSAVFKGWEKWQLQCQKHSASAATF